MLIGDETVCWGVGLISCCDMPPPPPAAAAFCDKTRQNRMKKRTERERNGLEGTEKKKKTLCQSQKFNQKREKEREGTRRNAPAAASAAARLSTYLSDIFIFCCCCCLPLSIWISLCSSKMNKLKTNSFGGQSTCCCCCCLAPNKSMVLKKSTFAISMCTFLCTHIADDATVDTRYLPGSDSTPGPCTTS